MSSTTSAGVTNPTRRPLLRSVLVTGLVVVLFLLTAAALASVFKAELGLRAALVGAAAAALPLAVVVPTYLWLDRFEAEPLRLKAFAFGWGALVAPLVALALNTTSLSVLRDIGVDHAASVEAVYLAPVVEESVKGLAVLLILWFRRRELDGVVDGVVYAGLAGAGFAFTENILYLGQGLASGGAGELTSVLVLRGVLGPFAHPLFTSCLGVAIGLAALRRSAVAGTLLVVLGWLVAVFLHGMWNLAATSGLQGYVVVYLLVQVPLFIGYLAFLRGAQAREGRLIGAHLLPYADAGWLTREEVRMLSSIPLRRSARTWAKSAGGGRGLRAMRTYQDSASELALLRARMLRVGADPTSLGAQEQLLRAVAVSRGVLFPPTAPVAARLGA